MQEEMISSEELQDCAKTPYFLVLSLMCKTHLFNYIKYPFEDFDQYARAGDEAFIIQCWYCDLWVSRSIIILTIAMCSNHVCTQQQEPTTADKQVYSFNFMQMIVELVRRDRRKVAPPTGSESEGEDEDHSPLHLNVRVNQLEAMYQSIYPLLPIVNVMNECMYISKCWYDVRIFLALHLFESSYSTLSMQSLFKRIVRKVSKYCPTLPSKAGCDPFEDGAGAEVADEEALDDSQMIHSNLQAYDPRMDPRNFEA
jgi:hypothetical protein